MIFLLQQRNDRLELPPAHHVPGNQHDLLAVFFSKFMLVLEMIGHALNMYCDRILAVFPNGKLTLKNLKDLCEGDHMAKLMAGVSEKIPMRSAILGAFSLFFQFLGYFALTAYIYSHSKIYGSILFVSIVLFITIGTAHHVKYALSEYVFLKLGRNETAKSLMLDLFNSSPITRICYAGYLVYIITLIVAIVTGVAAFPLWAVIFTILPVFIILFPFRIIGTLHIAAIASMLVWLILI